MAKLGFMQYLALVAALTVSGLGCAPRIVPSAEASLLEPNKAIRVLASGPIHGAFAEPVPFNPQHGIVAPKAPPSLIQEIPPDQKPEGAVQWIPGYWAWDDERNGYIWVSGIWRTPPPSRQWVRGYWTAGPGGYQWISGYWASVKTEAIEYLPEPPESLEAGPHTSAPSSEYFWIPGCWSWEFGRYAWQPGYWAVAHPDWIWVPAHYVWTSRGYVFVSGYRDYPVIRRGVLFSPVSFTPPVGHGITFFLSPGFVINLSFFYDALFVGVRDCHYYYGDYYAFRHSKRGIYPWFSPNARRVAYDPIYAHERWKHRKDHKWENRLHATFRERVEQESLRPKQSLDLHARPIRAAGASWSKRAEVVMSLDRDRTTRTGVSRTKPVKEKQRREFSKGEKAVPTYGLDRRHQEARPQKMQEQSAAKRSVAARAKGARSPIGDSPNERVIIDKASPARGKPLKTKSYVTLPKQKKPGTFSKQESTVREYGMDQRHQKAQAHKMQEQRVDKKRVQGRAKFASSPITDSPNERVIRNKAPPARDKPPKPNPDVQPLKEKKPRKSSKQKKTDRKLGINRPQQQTQPHKMQKQRAAKKPAPAGEEVASSPMTDRPNEEVIQNKASSTSYKAKKSTRKVAPSQKKQSSNHQPQIEKKRGD